MTASEFVALEEQIPAIEAQRSMQMAQAAVYPHVTKEGAERMWRHWERTANPPLPMSAAAGGGARFYWNGSAIDPAVLRTRLASTLGSGLAA